MSHPRSKQLTRIAIYTLMVVLGFIKAGAIDLPTPLSRCHVEDESCLINQVHTYFSNFKQGMPEFSVPSIEPLELGEVRVLNDAIGGSISFNLLLSNTTLHKFGDSIKVKSVKGFSKDLNKPMELSWVLNSPKLEVHANYDVKGKIMILPIVSKGDLIFHLTKVEASSRVSVVPEKHDDGHYHLKITEYKSDSKVESGHISVSNLFTENSDIYNSTMTLLNQEWNTLSADIQPKIIIACDLAFKKVLQKLWDTYPYDAFFDDV